jgi:glycosyltransferase involved in cell wall biosynthesis
MRIAQIAPLWELVPPRAYGGTELVVHLLTEGLMARGHEVTLFAASGSDTSGRLKTYSSKPLRELEESIKRDKTHCTVMATELRMLGDIFTQADEFDVIHNHIGFQALPFAEFSRTPVVTTLHNALAPEPVHQLFLRNAHLPYISISDYQQALWPELNYAATIYHGIDLSRFKPNYNHHGKNYLAFLGRLSPEKGPQHAIAIAKSLGMKLILAGKIDRVDQLFFDRELAHLIDGEQIRYIGELGHDDKVALLSNAAATLCPIEWPEPFGLVMIESMACGTPVFALRDGSVPEVIDHGFSGFIADSVEALTEAVKNYQSFDRRLVRKIAEDRFSMARMVRDHERLYEKLVTSPSGAVHRNELERMGRKAPPVPLTPSRLIEIRQGQASEREDPFWALAGQAALDDFIEEMAEEPNHSMGLPVNYSAGS